MYKLNEKLSWVFLGDETYIKNGEQEIELNSTASFIFGCIVQGNDNEAILNKIKYKYSSTPDSGEILNDIKSVIEAMTYCNIIKSQDIKNDCVTDITKYINNIQNEDSNLRAKYENIALEKLYPFSIHWDITSKCNFKCLHCCVKDRNHIDSDVSGNDVVDRLKILKTLGAYIVSFTGGEPLLYKDIYMVLQNARELGYEVHLLTNGSCLNDDIISLCKKYDILISLSLYGASEDTYEKITGNKTNFDKVITNINKLHENKNKYNFTLNLLKENINEIERINNICNKYGKKAEHNIEISSTLLGSTETNSHQINLDDINSIKGKINLIGGKDFNKKRNWNHICKVGRSVISIRPTGDITPCYHFPEVIGNIFSDDINGLWNNNLLLNKLREIESSVFEDCINCELSNYCDICLGKNYRENNSMYIPSKNTCQTTSLKKYIFSKL